MATSLLLRALHLGFLLAAAGTALALPGHRINPGLLFAPLAVYAHAMARVLGARGPHKAAVFLETLPFFAFGVAFLGRLDLSHASAVVLAGAAAGASILAGEAWLVPGTPTFGSSLAFILACLLAGLGLSTLSPWAVLGSSLLLGMVSAYGLARRRA